MGKIKSKFVRRTAGIFKERDVEFSEDFAENKKILKDTMPSKKVRNQMAGFLSRVKRQEKKEEIKALRR
ncbi:30S ribosomal protein S17e [archaeon]|jgi:ribosomal protein S17E|nr:30S ribosomal protein S17e [archaeon]